MQNDFFDIQTLTEQLEHRKKTDELIQSLEDELTTLAESILACDYFKMHHIMATGYYELKNWQKVKELKELTPNDIYIDVLYNLSLVKQKQGDEGKLLEEITRKIANFYQTAITVKLIRF